MHNLLAMCLVKLKSQLIKVEIMSHDQILGLATKPLFILVIFGGHEVHRNSGEDLIQARQARASLF
jgi:hypothetical protein